MIRILISPLRAPRPGLARVDWVERTPGDDLAREDALERTVRFLNRVLGASAREH